MQQQQYLLMHQDMLWQLEMRSQELWAMNWPPAMNSLPSQTSRSQLLQNQVGVNVHSPSKMLDEWKINDEIDDGYHELFEVAVQNYLSGDFDLPSD